MYVITHIEYNMVSDWTEGKRTFQRGEGVNRFGHNVLLAGLELLYILSLLALFFKLVAAFLHLLLFLICLQDKREKYIVLCIIETLLIANYGLLRISSQLIFLIHVFTFNSYLLNRLFFSF